MHAINPRQITTRFAALRIIIALFLRELTENSKTSPLAGTATCVQLGHKCTHPGISVIWTRRDRQALRVLGGWLDYRAAGRCTQTESSPAAEFRTPPAFALHAPRRAAPAGRRRSRNRPVGSAKPNRPGALVPDRLVRHCWPQLRDSFNAKKRKLFPEGAQVWLFPKVG